MITINDNICDISVSCPAILSCFLKMDLPTRTPVLLILPFLSFPLPLCVKLAAVVAKSRPSCGIFDRFCILTQVGGLFYIWTVSIASQKA